MSKQLINLSTKIAGKEYTYTGRFLGFIKDDEFNALVQKPGEVSTRLESKGTQPIMDVVGKFSTITGHRLVMTIKKVDDELINKKMLFISEGLDLIDSIPAEKDKKNGKVTFKSVNDETIEVQETE
jgi:hypothetical protein